MFEITFHDEDILQSFTERHKTYPGAVYDFTFENRFVIYHAVVAHALHYVTLDTKTGYGSEICTRRIGCPIQKSEYRDMMPRILSSIRYAGDRRNCDPMKERPLEVIDSIFREVLPHYGYTVREEQITLSKKIYLGLTEKLVSIAEAEVGTGKTLAYLIAAVVARHHNNLLHDSSVHPVTITTSSIELQKAMVEREIPALSRMLMDYRIITRPLSVVLRKGKEHYFCKKRYFDLMEKMKRYPEKYARTIAYFEKTDFASNAFDLDRFSVAPSLKGKICVRGTCKKCSFAEDCKYRFHLLRANKNPDLDFQITNHNLYLASAKMFDEEDGRLLRYSDFVIVDEAHKFKECAESVFGASLMEKDILKYLNIVKTLCQSQEYLPSYKSKLEEICELNHALFEHLARYLNEDDKDEDHGTLVDLHHTELTMINRLADAIGEIEQHRRKIPAGQPDQGKTLRKILLSFGRKNNKNVWVETDDNNVLVLHCTEKKIGDILLKAIWDKDVSHVLTSGTMSDGVNFDFFCHENGLSRIGRHLMQISRTDSPFDYEHHTRLYVPDNLPYPDKDDPAYIQAVADHITRIVHATNGHTAILFTSYKVLNAVYELTKDKLGKYEVICMTRSNKTAIADFKKSKNGVLFASGSMWEGVDCRGDSLSSVIIVRLPFPMRSVESEQRKDDCEDMHDFIRKHALPEMLIKLRQGVGRLIRSESDTGLITILDSRANSTYNKDIDRVMSKYPKVTSVGEIEAFFKAVKPKEYFD